MRAPAAATPIDWVARYDELSGRRDTLGPAELDELGLAAWFLGRQSVTEQAWDDAHRAYLEAGDTDAAIRSVFWLGNMLGTDGQDVKARAWMSRLLELCAAHPSPRAETTKAVTESVAVFLTGRVADAAELGERAVALARADGDSELELIATMGMGRAFMLSGHVEEGFACMDRVMLAISSGVVSDRVAGPAYCAVIASCLERWDVERARVWTRDLSDWCDAQRGLETFRGECSVHRATVLRLAGEWNEAESTLIAVCERERDAQTLENAIYWLGDLYRLAGRTTQAEDAYSRAAGLGREVQPGLALLRRDLGRRAVARSGIARALEASPPPGLRADLLAAQVELEVDHGDLDVARRAADGLRDLADTLGTPYLQARADRATALLLLATDAANEALPLLRRSWAAWRRLEAPYEAAITRVHLGRAARALGDEEAAQLEFDAARTVLTDLGAVPDLDRLERIASQPDPGRADGGLTRRELEVLRLIASGRSNRQIANDLFLSERTVARHVSNILTKLGLGNRTAATTFAYEHGLTATA